MSTKNRRQLLATIAGLAACRPRSASTEVAFAMWAGDEQRNRYFRGPVAAALSQIHGIALRIIPFADTAQFINKLLAEKQAGTNTGGSADMVWINGENFRSARQAGVLHGPFAESLPNFRLYPPESRVDFGTPVEGYEAPWQKAQFVFAYDTARTTIPSELTLDNLWAWAAQHPGRFTYIAPPDFTGSAFIRHVLLSCGERRLFADFNPQFYDKAAPLALRKLSDIRPFLWRKGETYPATSGELDRLFVNSEVDFSMSYGPAFASVRIARGEFPPTVRTFVLSSGTLANYNYLAIPFNAPNISGAKTVINYLMSFDVQLGLSQALQTPFPHALALLTDAQRSSVAALPRGPATLSDAVLAAHAIPEPHAEYLTRFERDWQQKVLPA